MPSKQPEPAIIPISCGAQVLTHQNDNAISAAMRRAKELLADAQKHRGSGTIIFDIAISDGQVTRDIGVYSKWRERV